MKIKCMKSFSGASSFNMYSEFIEKEEWKIERQLLKERVQYYQNKSYLKNLKEKFIKEKISIFPLKDEEAITWIDTMFLIRRILIKLLKKGTNIEDLKIIMEYPIVYGNHMRTDYLIIYDRLVVVLEFGMFNQDEKRSEERYTKKLHESISYLQIIKNSVDYRIDVVNYVLIYRPEYDRYLKKTISENVVYNEEELNTLAKFVSNQILNQRKLSAICQLEYLEEMK